MSAEWNPSSPCGAKCHKGSSQASAKVLTPCVLRKHVASHLPLLRVCEGPRLCGRCWTHAPWRAAPPLTHTICQHPFLYVETPSSYWLSSSRTALPKRDGGVPPCQS